MPGAALPSFLRTYSPVADVPLPLTKMARSLYPSPLKSSVCRFVPGATGEVVTVGFVVLKVPSPLPKNTVNVCPPLADALTTRSFLPSSLKSPMATCSAVFMVPTCVG